jgi:hypothetical protein
MIFQAWAGLHPDPLVQAGENFLDICRSRKLAAIVLANCGGKATLALRSLDIYADRG